MTLLRLIPAALLLALAACVTSDGARAPAAPSYYVLRHLEKGEGADPSLSETGQRNARLLSGIVASDRPSAIFVSTTRRARETAAPLAAELGLTMQEYDPRNSPALIERVRATPGTILIVGHSNTVPEIVEGLGGARPADIPETDYGDIYLVYGPERRVSRLRIERGAMPPR